MSEQNNPLQAQVDILTERYENSLARIRELEAALRESSQYLDDNRLNQIGSGSKLHCMMRNALTARQQADPVAASQGEEGREAVEVVAVQYEDGTVLTAAECGTALEVCAKVQTPLMTVAQHERIIAALKLGQS